MSSDLWEAYKKRLSDAYDAEARAFDDKKTPGLVLRYPTCGRCGDELEYDDGWRCSRCALSWSTNADEDEPAESTCYVDYDPHGDHSLHWRCQR